MGSRREALRAGNSPKPTPTRTLKPTANTITSGRTGMLQPKRRARNCVSGDSQDDSDDASSNRQHQGFGQELRQDVAPLGADGHAQADFAGALGDADEHDIHDADATHEQRHGGDGGQQQRRGRRWRR